MSSKLMLASMFAVTVGLWWPSCFRTIRRLPVLRSRCTALVCRAQWMEVCGSERLTGAILDRLTHRVHILEANGESYRLRDAKRRQKRRPPEN